MKWFLTSLVCVSSLLQAAAPARIELSKEAPAYDADLFRRDEPVYSFHGSFLYWRVQEGALDYALKMQEAAPGANVYAQGKFHKATFNGDPGFRVALSYFRAPHYWEIWGQYTRFVTSGKDRVGMPESSDIFLTGTWPQIIAAPLSEAESSIHLNYNMGELLVDRFYNPNPHLRLRLLGGGVVSWIHQNWNVHYKNLAGEESSLRNYWKFVGGGLKIGTMIDWYCGWDIYLTSTASISTLLGSYHNETKQIASELLTPVRNTHSRDVRTAFSVQGVFGPSWQKNFCHSRMEIFAGYEINTWFNLQEQYISSKATTLGESTQTWVNSGLIALQGLTARMTLDF
jgi:hypothetical protein